MGLRRHSVHFFFLHIFATDDWRYHNTDKGHKRYNILYASHTLIVHLYILEIFARSFSFFTKSALLGNFPSREAYINEQNLHITQRAARDLAHALYNLYYTRKSRGRNILYLGKQRGELIEVIMFTFPSFMLQRALERSFIQFYLFRL